MPIRVDLLACEPNTPGQARLAVKKWNGAGEGLEFSIQRNQDQLFLQNDRQWSNNPFWFQVAQFSQGADDTLETSIGPELVDPLLENSGSSNFRIELRERGGGLADQGVVRPAPGLLSSVAGGETRAIYDGGLLNATPEPAIEPLTAPEPLEQPEPVLSPAVEAVVEPVGPTPVENRKSRKLPLIIGLVVLLLIIAVGAWFWLSKPATMAPVTALPAASVASQATLAVAAPCTLESMGSQGELSFVQNCIRQTPDSTELLEIIVTAKQAGHCGIAQRLYANRAQAGDVLIAHAYAREYDPDLHQPSPCFAEPDAATAAYWYETILVSDPDDVLASQRLEELQP